MARPSLDEIFGAAPAPAARAARPSLDEIFAAPAEHEAPAAPPRIPKGTSGAETVARGFLPRSFKAAEEGAGPLRLAGAGAMDALSAPGRTVAAATEQPINPFGYPGILPGAPKSGEPGTFTAEGGRKFAESQADTQGTTFAGRLIRDPALPVALATGGAAMGLAGRAGLTGLKAATAAGALEGAGSAAIHQADKATQGQAMSGKEAALEVGLSAALPGVGAAVGAGARAGNKLLGKLAQELSGVSEEALRMHGSGFGPAAKELQAAAGKQHEIGSRLVNALDNLDDFLPEKDVVNQALQEMPAVNVMNTIQRLQTAKTGGALSSSRATNAKIDELVSDLTGAADQTGNIPAAKFREIRKEIDDLVGDAFGKESGKYVTALKEARHQMADDLATTAEASGRPEYVEAMRAMAQKLRKADDLKSFLGKSAQTREQRAESFISTLYGKNKEERRKAVAAMGEIFGEDFLADAKLTSLAAELGPEGKAALMPRQFTGRSLLGPLAGGALGYSVGGQEGGAIGLALGSPRLAGMALDASGGLARDLSRPALQKTLAGAGRAAARPWFRDEDQNR
jgi:hypothetical protein